MSTQVPLIIGTILALLGFLKWPRSTGELLGPRFVLPFMMWASIYGQFLVAGDRWDTYEEYHLDWDGRAMGYVCLCLVGYWLGYILPFGTWLTKLFKPLPAGLYLEPERLRIPGLLLCGLALTIQFLFNGFAVFYAGGGGHSKWVLPLSETIGRYLGILVDVSGIIGAVMIGFSWPEKQRRNFLNVGIGIFGLLMGAHVFMSRFSRASGLPFALAFGAASLRFRKVNILAGLIVLYVVAVFALTGLTGRGEYGHFSGSALFVKHLYSYSIYHPVEASQMALRAGDSFTSLVVTMDAVTTTDINALSPLAWIANQAPIPRAWGLPVWTTDPSRAVGTMHYTNPFWFTLGIYGDTYAHFGYLGFVWFIPIGIAFRMVSQLVIKGGGFIGGPAGAQYQPGYHFINLYALLLVMNYGAFLRGLFNTYRSFEVTFLLELGLITGLLMVVRYARGNQY